jgi:hypothetical protein
MTDDQSITQRHRHLAEFLRLLKTADPSSAIRQITHKRPLLVFWVAPDGSVIDASGAHHAHPPGGDRSILADPRHKGHLRGRAAYVGSRIYIVIYGVGSPALTRPQQALLRRSYPQLLRALTAKYPAAGPDVDTAQLIQEDGQDLAV